MLYLNFYLCHRHIISCHLTLTNVVFEYEQLTGRAGAQQHLTLTNVVFELSSFSS